MLMFTLSDQLNEIKKTTLARIFCDNTNNVLTMQPYVFYKPVTPRYSNLSL